ncbi:MAG: F0F1 ATP synthase subunit epsilon [candidate division KSB1 bacterium]|nr:F0F1 ATP synthase subunit epsilon [candidate division KSB1 bacterium]
MTTTHPKTFLLEIVTPFRKVFSEEVNAVIAPGEEGYFGVLPRHTPFLTSLRIGAMKVEMSAAGKEEAPRILYFAISGGFAEVLPDSVRIFAETAEEASEIDVQRAQAAKDRALKRIREGRKQWDLERAQAALARAINRTEVASKLMR